VIDWLSQHRVVATGGAGGPAHRAARALADLGARSSFDSGDEAIVIDGANRVRIRGRLPGRLGAVAAEYTALRAAALLIEGGGSLNSGEVSRDLREGLVPGGHRARVHKCRDGWVVARWRDPGEARLLVALLGQSLARAKTDEAEAAAAEARLLVTAVRPPPEIRRVAPRMMAPGERHRVAHSDWRVVDWTNLWSGPWATGRLVGPGTTVARVEMPGRRDGYFTHPRGRTVWTRWNGEKVLELADARRPDGRERLDRLIADAHLLVSSQTLRVLPQLGFGEEWFATRARLLSRIELTAFEPPRDSLPGLGEQAAAAAGLLWYYGGRPWPPRPWADPLLGAWALLVALVIRRMGVAGAHVCLSLEAAAARAVSAFELPEALEAAR